MGAFRIAGKIEGKVQGRAELQVAEVDARPPESLHRAQDGHHPGPLDAHRTAIRPAQAAAPATGAEIGFLASPFPGQRPDLARRHAGFRFLPFGRFRRPVLLPEYVGFPLVESRGSLFHEFLVVEILAYPHITKRLGERRVGAGFGRNPLAAQERSGVVEVRIDMHHLDAQFLGPVTPYRPLIAIARIRVAGPENDHLRFLQAILHRAVELRCPQPHAVAPVVHRTPVPPLPTVGVVVQFGTSQQIP